MLLCITSLPTPMLKHLNWICMYNICKWAFKRFDCKSIKFPLIAYGTYDIYKRLRLELHLRRLNVCFSSKALIYSLTGVISSNMQRYITYSTVLWPHCSVHIITIHIYKQFMDFSLFTQSWRRRSLSLLASFSLSSNRKSKPVRWLYAWSVGVQYTIYMSVIL